MSAHREPGDKAAFDQRMRIVPHDLPVLAGAGLRLVSVDDEISGPAVDSFGMKDHFSPVGKPAPPRPRRPDAFISSTIHSRPFSSSALVLSHWPRAIAPFRPQSWRPYRLVKMRSLSSSMSSILHRCIDESQPALDAREPAFDAGWRDADFGSPRPWRHPVPAGRRPIRRGFRRPRPKGEETPLDRLQDLVGPVRSIGSIIAIPPTCPSGPWNPCRRLREPRCPRSFPAAFRRSTGRRSSSRPPGRSIRRGRAETGGRRRGRTLPGRRRHEDDLRRSPAGPAHRQLRRRSSRTPAIRPSRFGGSDPSTSVAVGRILRRRHGRPAYRRSSARGRWSEGLPGFGDCAASAAIALSAAAFSAAALAEASLAFASSSAKRFLQAPTTEPS